MENSLLKQLGEPQRCCTGCYICYMRDRKAGSAGIPWFESPILIKGIQRHYSGRIEPSSFSLQRMQRWEIAKSVEFLIVSITCVGQASRLCRGARAETVEDNGKKYVFLLGTLICFIFFSQLPVMCVWEHRARHPNARSQGTISLRFPWTGRMPNAGLLLWKSWLFHLHGLGLGLQGPL